MKTHASPPPHGRNSPCPCGSGRKYKHCCLVQPQAQAARRPEPAAGTKGAAQRHAQWFAEAQRLQAQGELTAAVTRLKQILAENAQHAEALHLLGVLAHLLGEQEEARQLMQQAIASDGQRFLYHCNLGNVLYMQAELEAARKSFERAIELNADYAPAHYDLAVVLDRLGERTAAIAAYRRAARLAPERADSWRNLGVLLAEEARYEEAIASYRQALHVRPDYAEVHFLLGLLLARQGETDEAAKSYLRAIVHKRDFVAAHNNLCALLLEDNRYEEALTACALTLELDPRAYHAYINRAKIYRALGDLEANLEDTRHALELAPDYAPGYSNYLFALLYSAKYTPEEVFAEHLAFAQRFEAPLKAQWPVHGNSRDPQQRLRIGYVSGDFHHHAVSTFIEPVLAKHDRTQFEVYCYHSHYKVDAMTHHLMRLADHWRDCHVLSDDEMAARIQADGIDILVDLSGHTAYNRLLVFARKPAPLQLTWIGYPGTTGLSAMDYRITDAWMDPPGKTEHLHSEQLIRLSSSAPYRPEEGSPEVNELPALNSESFVFGSLNAAVKINQEVANLWGRILAAVPGSKLMLGSAGHPLLQARLLERFAQAGVSPEQLILQPRLPMGEYLALHQQIDLCLDPFPYNGGTTSMHALWMGISVLTLEGQTVASRVGTAILKRVGLDDFVVADQETYLQRAVELAHDTPRLAGLRKELRARLLAGNSSSERVCQELETSYRQIWQRWCDAPAAKEQ